MRKTPPSPLCLSLLQSLQHENIRPDVFASCYFMLGVVRMHIHSGSESLGFYFSVGGELYLCQCIGSYTHRGITIHLIRIPKFVVVVYQPP